LCKIFLSFISMILKQLFGKYNLRIRASHYEHIFANFRPDTITKQSLNYIHG